MLQPSHRERPGPAQDPAGPPRKGQEQGAGKQRHCGLCRQAGKRLLWGRETSRISSAAGALWGWLRRFPEAADSLARWVVHSPGENEFSFGVSSEGLGVASCDPGCGGFGGCALRRFHSGETPCAAWGTEASLIEGQLTAHRKHWGPGSGRGLTGLCGPGREREARARGRRVRVPGLPQGCAEGNRPGLGSREAPSRAHKAVVCLSASALCSVFQALPTSGGTWRRFPPHPFATCPC